MKEKRFLYFASRQDKDRTITRNFYSHMDYEEGSETPLPPYGDKWKIDSKIDMSSKEAKKESARKLAREIEILIQQCRAANIDIKVIDTYSPYFASYQEDESGNPVVALW